MNPHDEAWSSSKTAGGATMTSAPCGALVQRLVLVRAEDLRKEVRQDAAQQQVCVRDGQVPALAVAHRSGVRPRRLRPSLQEGAGAFPEF